MFCLFGTTEPPPGPSPATPDPNDEPKPKNGAGTTASLLILFFAAAWLNYSFVVPGWDEYANRFRFGFGVIALLYWGLAIGGIDGPNEYVKNRRKNRLIHAIKIGPGSKYGLNEVWYDQTEDNLKKFVRTVGIGGAGLVVYLFTKTFPDAPLGIVWNLAQTGWSYLHQRFTEHELFIGGVFGAFFVTFWAMALIFAVIEFTRPAFLLPFKCQESVVLTWRAFLQACFIAMINCGITLVVAVLVAYFVYPLAAPNGFSAEIPSFPIALLQLVAAVPMAEITFYWGHRLMHVPFFWYHVHYFHHTWKTPTAVVAIYAHPVEHLVVNVPTVILGPLLMGMHLSVFWVWAIAATYSTCHGHCGWHFPYFGSSQQHDYHHSQGYDNLGTLNVLDTYYHTNKDYLASWEFKVDKTYKTPDYPVDKIIAKDTTHVPSQPEGEEWLPSGKKVIV